MPHHEHDIVSRSPTLNRLLHPAGGLASVAPEERSKTYGKILDCDSCTIIADLKRTSPLVSFPVRKDHASSGVISEGIADKIPQYLIIRFHIDRGFQEDLNYTPIPDGWISSLLELHTYFEIRVI